MLYVNPIDTSASVRDDPARLSALRDHQAFQEFERIFLYQVVREMRKSTGEGLFGRSRETEFFEDMFSDHLAGILSESGGFGIAAQMEAQYNAVRTSAEAKDVAASSQAAALTAPRRFIQAYGAAAVALPMRQDAAK